MGIKHGKVVTHHEGLPFINSHNRLNMFPKDHVTNQKRYNTNVTRLIKVVTYFEKLLPINLRDPSIRSPDKPNTLYLHL